MQIVDKHAPSGDMTPRDESQDFPISNCTGNIIYNPGSNHVDTQLFRRN